MPVDNIIAFLEDHPEHVVNPAGPEPLAESAAQARRVIDAPEKC